MNSVLKRAKEDSDFRKMMIRKLSSDHRDRARKIFEIITSLQKRLDNPQRDDAVYKLIRASTPEEVEEAETILINTLMQTVLELRRL